MTTANVEFAQHVEHASQIDKNLYLGRLCWYTVSEMRVDHKQVVVGLHNSGLTATLPPYPKDFDVFRRVSTKAKWLKVPVPNATTFENYLIREVAGRGEDVVTRRIVVEEVDRKGKRLNYQQVKDVLFTKSTGLITVAKCSAAFVSIDPRIEANADHIITNIQHQFISWKGMLDNYAIREFIRKLLVSWGATCIRDGMYFVAEHEAEELAALETFVNNLPGGANFHSMPLIDDGKQREMLRRAFQAETSDSIDALMGEIREIKVSGKKISTNKYAEVVTKYQNLIVKTGEYEQLLDDELNETHSRLHLFQQAVLQLQECVK